MEVREFKELFLLNPQLNQKSVASVVLITTLCSPQRGLHRVVKPPVCGSFLVLLSIQKNITPQTST